MKKGWILPIFLLITASAIGYFAYTKFTKSPSKKTQLEAGVIPQYPQSESWQQNNVKNLCLFAADGCHQPSVISFETKNEWAAVYAHFMKIFPQKGWTTKSRVVTSVPTDVVFTKDTCQATLKPKEGNFLQEANKGQSLENSKTYEISVTCK